MSDAESAVLSIEALSLALPAGADRALAVEAVSLALHQQQIICVVGKSGSGKSICAYAIMGLLPQHVTIEGGHVRGRTSPLPAPRAAREVRGGASP